MKNKLRSSKAKKARTRLVDQLFRNCISRSGTAVKFHHHKHGDGNSRELADAVVTCSFPEYCTLCAQSIPIGCTVVMSLYIQTDTSKQSTNYLEPYVVRRLRCNRKRCQPNTEKLRKRDLCTPKSLCYVWHLTEGV
jgi:hypothetical protein